ncbi:MAG: carboxypeptidase regulatory-like domain-containing protein [Planctomycetaceae bacterium]
MVLWSIKNLRNPAGRKNRADVLPAGAASVLLLFIALAVESHGRSARGDDAKVSSPTGGTIEGTITYKADAKRLWRYGRYYVKPKSGELSGALVALDAPSLRKSAPPGKPDIVLMDQKDVLFTPETLAIRAGDKVRFTNSDSGTHNISTTSDLHPFSVSISHGDETVQTFPRAGGIRRPIVLGCVFHSQMRAWIFVFDHPHYQLTGEDGRFRLANIPPGEYRLEMVHPAGELRTGRRVELKAGETVKIDLELTPDNKAVK